MQDVSTTQHHLDWWESLMFHSLLEKLSSSFFFFWARLCQEQTENHLLMSSLVFEKQKNLIFSAKIVKRRYRAALTREISSWKLDILITMFLTTFRRFPTTFRRFPKIFLNCSEGLTNVSKHFWNIFRRFPKAAEDFWGGTDDVSIIQHHLWVLFHRLCSHSNGNLKTCDNL